MTINVLIIIFLLGISGDVSTAPFALFANALLCVPKLMPSRQDTSLRKRSYGKGSKLCTRNSFSGAVGHRRYHQHDSMHSIQSLPMALFDEPSTMPLANRTSDDQDKPYDSEPKTADPAKTDLYFIRPAMFVDMDRASKILADGFFKGPDSNWFKYQYEKFITYLSLEANFPRTQQQRSRYEIYVACCVDTGEVWGLVEIDARGSTTERTSKVFEKSGGSPYMCNLAVDEKQKRKGIATSLVFECERQVMEWYSDDEKQRKKKDEEIIDDDMVYSSKDQMINDIVGRNNIDNTKREMRNSVCLKVRESNTAAVGMYLSLGYLTVSKEIEDGKPDENILLMRKELTTLPPSLLEGN